MPHFLVTVAPREAGAGEVVHALYLLSGPALTATTVELLAAALLSDPVVQYASWRPLDEAALVEEALPPDVTVLEIAYRPGVTDNEGEMVVEGARRLELPDLAHARALRRHLLPPGADAATRAAELTVAIVQTSFSYAPRQHAAERLAFYRSLITPPETSAPHIATVPLRAAADTELSRISRDGLLALDLDEMRAVQAYFAAIGRDPTDGELETIAQTWSEHCSHKTFKAKVRYQNAARSAQNVAQLDPALYPMLHMLDGSTGEVAIDSLIKTFLMSATRDVLAARAALGPQPSARQDPWVRSAFVDNAGILAFGEAHEVSIKVETHNHPSALEPFGGANTGVGGVIRDVLGVSAEPIANTDVLCFGMPDAPAESIQPGVLHPARIATGVVAGIRDYGNKLGIPIVNGAVLFDPGYTANPLVYCGTVGIAPRDAHPRNVQPGDAVVVLGGRTGRDGIHGATFSSIELTHETAATVGSAVQIGDPITEKKLLDVLLQARDQRLYSAITDCGAGGLSSAVGEMGAECGAEVQLERVTLKYAGLQPWEIWLSEAQERMVLAIPPANLAAFLALCAAEDVEAAAIGSFTADGHLRVTYADRTVVDLEMAFLHDGRPQRVMEATWAPQAPRLPAPGLPIPTLQALLPRLLAHPTVASKERIVRTYDHEVRGATVIKPLVGAAMDGPGDAAVLRPLPDSWEGLALGSGINPRYGKLDPYWMALAAVDEALRNVVAVGGDPARTAILDNFCWGDPRKPDRMAGLVRATAGCYDAAVALGTPFVSGKDSLNNEYRDADGSRVAIPPTLLITALAHVPDVRRTVTMDLKEPGDTLYLIGATRHELAASHLSAALDADAHWEAFAAASDLPRVDLAAARRTFAALHRAIAAGLVRACHDCSEGGLAVAAAEMAIAGDHGLDLDLAAMDGPEDPAVRLFSESPSRFLVEVRPADRPAFEAALMGVPVAAVGTVTTGSRLRIAQGAGAPAELQLAELRQAWKSGLADIDL